jgi:hypothetical protein
MGKTNACPPGSRRKGMFCFFNEFQPHTSPIDRYPDRYPEDKRPSADDSTPPPVAYTDLSSPLAESLTRHLLDGLLKSGLPGNVSPEEVPPETAEVTGEGDLSAVMDEDAVQGTELVADSGNLSEVVETAVAVAGMKALVKDGRLLTGRDSETDRGQSSHESGERLPAGLTTKGGDPINQPDANLPEPENIDVASGPPDNPRSPGEVGSPEPSEPLVAAITGRWLAERRADRETSLEDTDDGRYSGIADGTAAELATCHAHTEFVRERLRNPGVAVDPEQVARAVVADELVDRVAVGVYWELSEAESADVDALLAALHPADYEMYRDVARDRLTGHIMTEVDAWNHGDERPEDSLAFERLQPYAEIVAARHGVEPADAFADDAFYRETFRETYPEGPSQYVGERMQARGQGYALARRLAHDEATTSDTMGGTEAIGNPTVLTAREYIFRVQLCNTYELVDRIELVRRATDYDDGIAATLERIQAQQIRLTRLRVQDVWGEGVEVGLPEEQRAWLNGALLATPERMLPAADRERFRRVVAIRNQILAQGFESMPPEGDGMLTVANRLAEYIVRAGELSMEELVAVAHALDTMPHRGGPTPIAYAEGGLDLDPFGEYLARLHVDTMNFGLLNTQLAHTLNEPGAAALRYALVARQARLLYPELFPDLVRRQGAAYYQSEHFLQFNQFIQLTLDRYLASPEPGYTADGTNEPLGGTGDTGSTGSRIIIRAQPIEDWEIALDTHVVGSTALEVYLGALGVNSGLFVERGEGTMTAVTGDLVKFTGSIVTLLSNTPGTPSMRYGDMRIGDRTVRVAVHSYATQGNSVGGQLTAARPVAHEYAAAQTLELLHENRLDMLAPRTIGFLRYTAFDAYTGRPTEYVANVVQLLNEVVTPQETRIEERPDSLLDVVTETAQALARLHAKGFTAQSSLTVKNIGADGRGQLHCLDIPNLRPLATDNPDRVYLERIADIYPLVNGLQECARQGGLDLSPRTLRFVFYHAYANMMTPQDRYADEYLGLIRHALNIEDH